MNFAHAELAHFLKADVEPKASECDTDFTILNHLFKRMGEHELYALSIRAEMAQKPLTKIAMFDNKALETKTSGALSFLTSQINLSTRLIYEGHNDVLKKNILPKVLSGEVRIANAVSHLRSQGAFEVERVQGGYLVTGTIHWLTGYNHFEQFVFGFQYQNQEYFALLPFKNCNDMEGKLTLHAVLPVLVMQATQTVRATLNRFFIADEMVIHTQSLGTWNKQMRQNSAILAYFYGIGMGALEVVQTCYANDHIVKLQEKMLKLREEIIQSEYEDYTELRVKLTHCAWQCLQCAIVVSKGQAMDPKSRVSRLYREIVQFNALATLSDYTDNQLAYIIQPQ